MGPQPPNATNKIQTHNTGRQWAHRPGKSSWARVGQTEQHPDPAEGRGRPGRTNKTKPAAEPTRPKPAPAQPPKRAGQPSWRVGSNSARRAIPTSLQDQLGPAESGGGAGSGRPEDGAGLRMLHPEPSRKEPAKHGREPERSPEVIWINSADALLLLIASSSYRIRIS